LNVLGLAIGVAGLIFAQHCIGTMNSYDEVESYWEGTTFFKLLWSI
jgi:hypothetical protein